MYSYLERYVVPPERRSCLPRFLSIYKSYDSLSPTCLLTYYAPSSPDWQAEVKLFNLSVRPFVRSFVCYQTCEHDSLKTNKPNRL